MAINQEMVRDAIRLLQNRGIRPDPRSTVVELATKLCRDVYGYRFTGDELQAELVVRRFVTNHRDEAKPQLRKT